MKNCSLYDDKKCAFKIYNDGHIQLGCKYTEYCDFQLPRDSRPIINISNPIKEETDTI